MERQNFIKTAFALGVLLTLSIGALAGLGVQGTHTFAPANHETTAMADATYTAYGVEPNPVMNTNATWSTFYSGYSPLEYNNGSGNATINAQLNQAYQNPISVNPADIISPKLQNDNLGSQTTTWENDTSWAGTFALNGGVHQNAGKGTLNGQPDLYLEANTSGASTNTANRGMLISSSNWPSSNPAYDYITITGELLGPSMSGVTANIQLKNATETGVIHSNNEQANMTTGNENILPNQPFYFDLSLQTAEGSGMSFNPTNSPSLQILAIINLPQTATNATYNLTITDMAFTSTPYTLGTNNAYGKNPNTPTAIIGNANLTALNPTFPYSEIANGGYTASISQSIQNITTSQTSINNGQYIEQATFQGYMQLPSAPDLTYSNANITMNMAIPGNQYVVANLNGVSYLTEVQALKNGTMNFGTVNPTTQNSIVLEVQFTTSQWNSVSAPPSFWTNPVGAIEYYWYVALGVVLGAVGIGAGIGSKAEGFRAVKK